MSSLEIRPATHGWKACCTERKVGANEGCASWSQVKNNGGMEVRTVVPRGCCVIPRRQLSRDSGSGFPQTNPGCRSFPRKRPFWRNMPTVTLCVANNDGRGSFLGEWSRVTSGARAQSTGRWRVSTDLEMEHTRWSVWGRRALYQILAWAHAIRQGCMVLCVQRRVNKVA